MVWLIIGVMILGLLLDSDSGKFALGLGVASLGFFLLEWVLEIAFFLTLSKICLGIMIAIVAFMIIGAIADC